MTDLQVAFFIGLFGSIHCVGMCGPLAFALPANSKGKLWLIFDKFIYQLGRIISYTLLGLLIGLVGRQVWLAGIQQSVSIISGALIITAGLARIFKWSSLYMSNASKPATLINKAIVYTLKHKWGHLVVGMLNGLLPCGFVYVALVGAVNTPSVASSAQYMFWFGVGTLPLMFAAALGSGFININVRRKLNKVVPYFMLLLGVWFVMRGMSLNIAYLSPTVNVDQSICR